MHVRVRFCGNPEAIVVVPSKLTKIDTFRKLLEDKFNVEPGLQRLFYGGKLLEDGYSFHDYNIKLNDVIQLMQKIAPLIVESDKNTGETNEKEITSEKATETKVVHEDAVSKFYRVGDLVDIKDRFHSAWFEGKILQIVKDPEHFKKIQSTSSKSNGTISNGTTSNGGHELTTTKSPSKRTNPPRSPKKTPQKSDKESKPVVNGNHKSPKTEPDDKPGSSNCDSPKSRKSPKSANTTPQRGIKDYFAAKKKDDTSEVADSNEDIKNKTPENKKSDKLIVQKSASPSKPEYSHDEKELLFKVCFHDEDESSAQYCKLSEIRPRSRTEIDIEDLKANQMVLLNYNPEQPNEKGFWFDFCIQEIKTLRKNTELVGTLYHGKDIPQDDVRVRCHDKFFTIESVIPISDRTKEYEKLMITPTEKRAAPLTCTKCRDNTDIPCRECGCYICAGKNLPDQTILCDECNMGYHMTCLQPALECLPSEEWYCPDCKRDPDSVVAPGAKKQTKKPNQGKSSRDWGRGMACVGKTQTCSMPANHFGPIPGIDVGMAWRFRIQLSESGVHRPPVSGIHGRDVEGAYSIVLSGGYEDDVDHGFEFTYTGSGGRDLSGNKRTADQSSDQTLTRENKALARNCAVKEVKEEGADAGDKWRDGKPVRVVRSYKMLKHFPEYAPQEGIRYDGIYKIVKYYQETGKSGFKVWKYLVRRDDPNPAPWEKGGKTFPIVYPPGYLEAEAEKKAQKEREKLKKNPAANTNTPTRVLRESNGNTDESESNPKIDAEKKKKRRRSKKETEASPPVKKMKTRSSLGQESKDENKAKPRAKPSTPKVSKEKSIETKTPSKLTNPFTMAASSKKTKLTNGHDDLPNGNVESEILSKEDKEAIKNDLLNKKLWDECLEAMKKEGKQGLINKVTTHFLCIICQEIAANPVTTSCSHNFCMGCLKLAFKSTESQGCPHCRTDLSKEELSNNDNLKSVLRAVLPGYDVRKK